MLKTAVPVEQIVREAIEFLTRTVSVDAVVLFGSQISGEADESSDIDVAVISDELVRMPFREQIKLFSRAIMAVDVRLEFHLYSCSDYLNPPQGSFLRLIKNTGRVLKLN
ncbi:MAG: nucleotidyltransferase domain-containing protein [Candidatus Omnitrophica bacterium]|nr:nucleotidyltransferase domain-containing protein [Candidatus Omnitrophota bacterium]